MRCFPSSGVDKRGERTTVAAQLARGRPGKMPWPVAKRWHCRHHKVTAASHAGICARKASRRLLCSSTACRVQRLNAWRWTAAAACRHALLLRGRRKSLLGALAAGQRGALLAAVAAAGAVPQDSSTCWRLLPGLGGLPGVGRAGRQGNRCEATRNGCSGRKGWCGKTRGTNAGCSDRCRLWQSHQPQQLRNAPQMAPALK